MIASVGSKAPFWPGESACKCSDTSIILFQHVVSIDHIASAATRDQKTNVDKKIRIARFNKDVASSFRKKSMQTRLELVNIEEQLIHRNGFDQCAAEIEIVLI